MGVPTPSVALMNICSTIFNNTFYTFSETAFQSLRLEQGATWETLEMGVPVTGAVCVQSTPPDHITPAALYVVGGATNGTTDNYPGLQRYIFGTAKWETISPTTPVTQGRLYHNAVYLNTSASILVYAGTQDGSKQESSQTFTINTTAPYEVLAYESWGAPPAVQPLLMPWSQSKAVMMGGSSANKNIFIFSPSKGWVDSNSSLAEPLKPQDAVRAVVINGNDGSKNLYTFDMTVSPNAVNRTIIIDGEGNPVSGAKAILSRDLHEAMDESVDAVVLEKRANLTVDAWPKYNATLAPQSTRNIYTMAKDPGGLVVIAGGSTTDVLCMFRARQNSWVNASSVFSANKAVASPATDLPTSSTILPSNTAAASASASPEAAVATTSEEDAASRAYTMKILGITLGIIGGIALFLGLILLFLRWRRRRSEVMEVNRQRRTSGLTDDEKAPTLLEFTQTSKPFAKGHGGKASQGSFSSIAVLMGKQHKKDLSSGQNSNTAIGSSREFPKTSISKPMPQAESPIIGDMSFVAPSAATLQPIAQPNTRQPPSAHSNAAGTAGGLHPTKSTRSTNIRPRGSGRRSSGWNKYWSGGSGVLGFGGSRQRDSDSPPGDASDRDSGSSYATERIANSPDRRTQMSSKTGMTTLTTMTQASAMPPPLSIPNLQPPSHRLSLNRVISGSPTISQYESSRFTPHEGITPSIERQASVSSMSSYESRRDAFSSGVPDSIADEHRAWDALDNSDYGSQTGFPSSSQPERQYWPAIDQSLNGHGSLTYSESNYNAGRSTMGDLSLYGERPREQAAPPLPNQVRSQEDMSWLNLGADGNGKI